VTQGSATNPSGSSPSDHLLQAIGQMLPPPYGFDASPGAPPMASDHPLALEIEALRAGLPASLPYPGTRGVTWFTVAPTQEKLRGSIVDLRAWVFPSFAWEDHKAPIGLPGTASGRLGPLIAAVSPSGYFRWHSAVDRIDTILRRLRQMRLLERRRPSSTTAPNPTLFELRHRFQVAIGVGDAAAARGTLAAIDAGQLDSAVNVGFMRLRFHAAFDDDQSILSDAALPSLLQMRMPTRIRSAVLRAHHRLYLHNLEREGRLSAATARYGSELHDLIGAQIGGLDRDDMIDDTAVIRLAAYRLHYLQDLNALRDLAQTQVDEVVAALLAALQVGDRRAELAQDVALEGGSVHDRGEVHAALIAELPKTHPDPSPVADGTGRTLFPIGWSELSGAFRRKDWQAVDGFLSASQDGGGIKTADRSSIATAIGEALLELATLADTDADADAARRFNSIMLAAIDTSEPALSRPEYRPVYAVLLPIWSERRRYSTFPPDGHLLLALVDAIFTHGSAQEEVEAVISIRSWWQARPVPRRLAWLLDALDLISEQSAVAGSVAHDVATALWVDGAEQIRRDPETIPRTSLALWHRIGARLGFDSESIVEFLGPPATVAEQVAADPLRNLSAKRVAIVTLQEKAAIAARDILRGRISADILVVCEHAAGAQTDAARSADVILFAWAANKHAVYEAFDGVRDRLEYVSGKGASSIVTALERWATQRSEVLA